MVEGCSTESLLSMIESSGDEEEADEDEAADEKPMKEHPWRIYS